jgi:hypothetical protein
VRLREFLSISKTAMREVAEDKGLLFLPAYAHNSKQKSESNN